jgi:hypothetical protein
MALAFVLAAGACAPAAAPPAPTAAPKPAATSAPAGAATAAPKAAATRKIVLGFTASQTGAQNVASKKQIEGQQLWLDNVNKSGGIKL